MKVIGLHFMYRMKSIGLQTVELVNYLLVDLELHAPLVLLRDAH